VAKFGTVDGVRQVLIVVWQWDGLVGGDVCSVYGRQLIV